LVLIFVIPANFFNFLVSIPHGDRVKKHPSNARPGNRAAYDYASVYINRDRIESAWRITSVES
jgi:hypothetical protein